MVVAANLPVVTTRSPTGATKTVLSFPGPDETVDPYVGPVDGRESGKMTTKESDVMGVVGGCTVLARTTFFEPSPTMSDGTEKVPTAVTPKGVDVTDVKEKRGDPTGGGFVRLSQGGRGQPNAAVGVPVDASRRMMKLVVNGDTETPV